MNAKIKQLFAQLLKLGSYQSEAGTLIYEGELGIGTEVFIEDEKGELIPAPDGTYGEYTVIGGTIAEPAAVEEVIKENKEEATNIEIETLKAENEELRNRIAELEKELDAKAEEFKAQLKPAEDEIKENNNKQIFKYSYK